jgi:hypothetical protein
MEEMAGKNSGKFSQILPNIYIKKYYEPFHIYHLQNYYYSRLIQNYLFWKKFIIIYHKNYYKNI